VKRNISGHSNILWRCKYLCQMKCFRGSSSNIYFLDVTKVKDIRHETFGWYDSKKQETDTGLRSTHRYHTTHKERGLIFHVGSESGVVDGGCSVLSQNPRKITTEKWQVVLMCFYSVLAKLRPNCVTGMQNASYHVKAELISSVWWRKDIVLKWPEDRGSAHSAAFLPEIAKTVSKHYNKYVFSETAEREQSTLFRSYHLTIDLESV
jgi:hypothetical protein